MKTYWKISAVAAALFSVFACAPKEEVDFAIDTDKIEMPAEGGTFRLSISSPGSWVARSNDPWVTISPANGNGSGECQVIVDSALAMVSEAPTRQTTITIQKADWENRQITVEQKNFDYSISLDDTEIEIPDYIALSERYFDVKVSANVQFNVDLYSSDNQLIDDDPWITAAEDNPELQLTKGARPRNVTLRFDWDINQEPNDKAAKLVFTPVGSDGAPITPLPAESRVDTLYITQTSAAAKPENARAADSTALLAISRALNTWSGGWDSSARMERWDNVRLWKEGDEGCPEGGVGRVRYARFFLFNTDDGLPYQVGWLDAAEELIFYSNENAHIREDIEVGEDIMNLHQLKRLTISAYGIDENSFPENFYEYYDEKDGETKKTFPDLEYLNISGNNFTEVPEWLTPENFPSLRAIEMTTNQKLTAYDLDNLTVKDPVQFAEQYGGLFRENSDPDNISGSGFPAKFLTWEKLDTLLLTLNYLQGTIPTDEQIISYMQSHGGVKYWSTSDTEIADSISTVGTRFFTDNQVPKVLPNMMRLTVNLNRFHGTLSPETHKWLLYHPKLDWWDPYVMFYNQEGTDFDGNAAQFTGVPVSFEDYGDEWPSYYGVYYNKEFSPTYTPPADEE